MTVHTRRLKAIDFTVTDPNDNTSPYAAYAFRAQITSFTLTPPQDDGELVYTYGPEGSDSYVEDVDGAWTLELTFVSDWRTNGISDFLLLNAGKNAAFELDHHPDIEGEHVHIAGMLRLKCPPIGGDARTTETQTVTMQLVGEPTVTKVEESSESEESSSA